MTATLPGVNIGALDRLVPYTLLSLDRFARIVSYSPILFHQVVIMHNELQRDSSCSDPVLQYTWQYRGGGRPGRTEIAQAIQQAEDLIYRVLKFPIAPTWFTDEIDFVGATGRFNLGVGYDRAAIRTHNFNLIELGTPKYELLETAQISWLDHDGDTYPGVGFVELTVPEGTREDELHAFFPDLGHDPSWEIRPITVHIDEELWTAQVAFARHLCVLPELQERLDAVAVDGMEDTNFLDSIAIYRLTTDYTNIGSITYLCGGCGVCTACTTNNIGICGSIVDPRNGLVVLQPALWNEEKQVFVPDRCTWVTPPTRVKLNYKAGFTTQRVTQYPHNTPRFTELERATAYLALSLLDRDWLTCEQIRNLQAHWRFDLAKSESSPAQSSSFRLDPYMLRCPFGTTRAAIYAWRVLQPLMVGEAVLNI